MVKHVQTHPTYHSVLNVPACSNGLYHSLDHLRCGMLKECVYVAVVDLQLSVGQHTQAGLQLSVAHDFLPAPKIQPSV